VAQGRVWTGAEAKANGLVDALGGYATALRLAKAAAGIPAGAPVELTVFPRQRSLAETLYDWVTGKPDEDTIGVTALGRAVEAAEPLLLQLDALADDPRSLLMPPIAEPR
jgi:protease-4